MAFIWYYSHLLSDSARRIYPLFFVFEWNRVNPPFVTFSSLKLAQRRRTSRGCICLFLIPVGSRHSPVELWFNMTQHVCSNKMGIILQFVSVFHVGLCTLNPESFL